MGRVSLAVIVLILVGALSCSKDNDSVAPPTTGSILGLVRTAVGDTVLAGAQISTLDPTSSVTTNAQGHYEIPNVLPGPYVVTATKGGYDPGSIAVSVAAGAATTADIVLTHSGPALPTEGTILGQVRTSVGDTLIVGATVATVPVTGSVTTDHQGHFTILHVRAGQYTVTATKTGYNPGHTAIAVVVGQTTNADIRLTRPPGATVFCDWTMADASADSAAGDLGGVSVSFNGSVIDQSWLDGDFVGFNHATFLPALEHSDAIGFQGTSVASYTYSFVFSQPVRNPILHFYSLASDLTFAGADTLVKLSGDPDFLVAGNVVSGMLNPAPNEYSPSGYDANGTVQLRGTFTSISFSAHYAWGSGLDGVVMQVGAAN